jgi:hypothetical protein
MWFVRTRWLTQRQRRREGHTHWPSPLAEAVKNWDRHFATSDFPGFSPFPLGASPIFSQPRRVTYSGLPIMGLFDRPIWC